MPGDTLQRASVQLPAERRSSRPEGRQDCLRGDATHQGDRGKVKGVYPINMENEVTQFRSVTMWSGLRIGICRRYGSACWRDIPVPHLRAACRQRIGVDQPSCCGAGGEQERHGGTPASELRAHPGPLRRAAGPVPPRGALSLPERPSSVLLPGRGSGCAVKRYRQQDLLIRYEKLQSLPAISGGIDFTQLDTQARARSDFLLSASFRLMCASEKTRLHSEPAAERPRSTDQSSCRCMSAKSR